ncbi:MAG: hypothetical protein K2W82_02635 [Candidatus Obscuribacterales bacterium]|nr:hypothetical protein [Candidatus Obscuribacterales bacterium]
MAIQLSERDVMIFKFIEEHHVLLEKHIAWFISCDDKPVLIRDRLRKLFYLDYLFCQRHGGKLPWWTTPTKPLVYMLSPLARSVANAKESEIDISDHEMQRYLLEIANLRMLFLMEQKSGMISDFSWLTREIGKEEAIASIVSFRRNGALHRIGIVNHQSMSAEQIIKSAQAVLDSGKTDMIWIISKDDAQQDQLQKTMSASSFSSRLAFVTHQEIYRSGIVKSKWQSVNKQFAPVIADSTVEPLANWNPTLATA